MSSKNAPVTISLSPIRRSSDGACARRHHAAEGGIAFLVLPAALHLQRGGGRQERVLGELGQRLRVLEGPDLHGHRRRTRGRRAACAGLHRRRHRGQLGGCLADELVCDHEWGRRPRRGASGHAAERAGGSSIAMGKIGALLGYATHKYLDSEEDEE
ncbi:interferon alpha-inducible protein 6 isoform X1 [Theropithecus gelada]|uniref:interferon alpha-inducible protein 6 isoform X1 n=1 Tax=Theropithecus gelada TaxID=9565 RepID=UPI000DC19069|nr:interferon alpha-inducible protein 6 isoform X1 [Theropithecus gelada]